MTMAEEQPSQRPRYSVRRQARLNADTHAKLEVLAKTFHRKRAAILRYVMHWGLAHTQGWTIDQSIPARVHPVTMLVEPILLQQVQAAARHHGVSVVAWERHAMRQVTLEDFPSSRRAGETVPRSHDSGHYGTRFMLRLDDETSIKLATLTQAFHRSAAEVIRQLVAQARPEDFPESWQLAVEERWHRRTTEAEDADTSSVLGLSDLGTAELPQATHTAMRNTTRQISKGEVDAPHPV
jgi:predicted transcriptional regulator